MASQPNLVNAVVISDAHCGEDYLSCSRSGKYPDSVFISIVEDSGNLKISSGVWLNTDGVSALIDALTELRDILDTREEIEAHEKKELTDEC